MKGDYVVICIMLFSALSSNFNYHHRRHHHHHHHHLHHHYHHEYYSTTCCLYVGVIYEFNENEYINVRPLNQTLFLM